jgi:hypothetical protein
MLLTCELRNKEAHEKNPNEARPQFTSAIRTRGIDVYELVAIGNSHVHKAKGHDKIYDRGYNRVDQEDDKEEYGLRKCIRNLELLRITKWPDSHERCVSFLLCQSRANARP